MRELSRCSPFIFALDPYLRYITSFGNGPFLLNYTTAKYTKLAFLT